MGYLQNSMDDFANLHDAIAANVAPYTNFSSEPVSSALFIVLFATSILLFLVTHLLPWRLLFLLSGWGAIISGHPKIKAMIDSPRNQNLIATKEDSFKTSFFSFVLSDIALDPDPERREVEIFELQSKPMDTASGEHWEAVLFSPTAYTPMSPSRISGDQPRGTPSFEEVMPPKGWKWADKKWSLDLLAREWVEERCITGVEVELEGGRWVVDSVKVEGDQPKDPQEAAMLRSGHWRRRRWVRAVERIVQVSKDQD